MRRSTFGLERWEAWCCCSKGKLSENLGSVTMGDEAGPDRRLTRKGEDNADDDASEEKEGLKEELLLSSEV